MDFVNELLQVSGIRGHEFDLSANFIPLIIRSIVFMACLMVTVFVMPISSSVSMKDLGVFKCSLVKCLLRNLDTINDWLNKIGIYQIAKTTWEDLVPRSPKQALMVVVKIYLALVMSLLLYRKVFKNEKKKSKKQNK